MPPMRVAAHLPQRLDVVRQQQRLAAHAGRGQRGFGAGMAAADHDHIKFLGYNILQPDRRPPGAPVKTEASFTPEQMAQFLRGIEGTPPGNVTTIVATGQWFVPMRHPGATPPYDLRGWHATPAPATPAASSPR
jgi:hypothetical protein